METPGYILLSSQVALERAMDVVAQNVANMNTTGYRRQSVLFTDYLTAPAGPGGDQLALVNDYGAWQDTSAGPLTSTANPLDVAIEGDGYLSVEGPAGTLYTRAGALAINDQGELVERNGLPVLGEGGSRITVPSEGGPIGIAADGTVTQGEAQLGRLAVVRFEREQFLTPRAGGLYDAGDEPAEPATEARLRQGMLEGSNVKPVVEMTTMIDVLRSYQSAQRMAQSEHDRQLDAIRTLGEVA